MDRIRRLGYEEEGGSHGTQGPVTLMDFYPWILSVIINAATTQLNAGDSMGFFVFGTEELKNLANGDLPGIAFESCSKISSTTFPTNASNVRRISNWDNKQFRVLTYQPSGDHHGRWGLTCAKSGTFRSLPYHVVPYLLYPPTQDLASLPAPLAASLTWHPLQRRH